MGSDLGEGLCAAPGTIPEGPATVFPVTGQQVLLRQDIWVTQHRVHITATPHLHPQPRGFIIRGSHHFSPESLQQGPSFSAHLLHPFPIHFPHSCCDALSKHRPSRAILHFKTTRWLLITSVVQSGPPAPYTLALTNSSEMVPLFTGLLVLSLPHAFPL